MEQIEKKHHTIADIGAHLYINNTKVICCQ